MQDLAPVNEFDPQETSMDGGHDDHDHSNCDHDHDHDHEHNEEDRESERQELINSFKSLENDLDVMIRALKPTEIVRDIRRIDPRIFQRYFRGYRPNKIGRGKMVSVLKPAIMEDDNIAVMQLLSLMWNRRSDGLHREMRDLVATINEDVEAIEAIEDDKATEFVSTLTERGYERAQIHICVRVNGVRFSEDFIRAKLSPSQG